MPVITPRRLGSAVAIPALALGIAACSSGSGGSSDEDGPGQLSPQEVVLASYDGLAGESYRMEMTMTVNDLDFVEATTVVDGEASRVSQDMYMSVLLEAMGQNLSEDPELAGMMESMFTDMHSETILVDGVAYMQLSGGMFGMSEQLGEDAWFTADLAEQGDLGAIYEQIGSFDLASQTETLLGGITDVTETGDGVYTGTLSGDSEVVQSMLGAAGDSAGAAALDAAEVEVVVTVDDAGLLETMEMTFPEIEGMSMHLVNEVVEIGGSYDITAPDSDNLHSFDELFGATQ